MSRRDEVAVTLGDALATIRQDLSAALQASTHSPPASSSASSSARNRSNTTPSTSRGSRLTNALSTWLDPTLGSSAAGPSSTSHSSSSVTHQVYDLPPETAARSAPGSTENLVRPSSSRTPTTIEGMTLPPDEGDGDELPSYTRRAPGSSRNIHLPQPRLHVLSSRSNKLQVQLKAPGESHVILMQPSPNASVHLEGKLTVHLPAPEAVTQIRIKLKILVRTIVIKAHGSGRHPVTDEVTIYEDSHVCFESVNGTTLVGNESADPLKLQGNFNFDFKLKIPGKVSGVPSTVASRTRQSRPTPPSFVLSSQDASDPRVIWAGKSSPEWASCRYFLKVTMARKGLLNMNERFLVPLIYVPAHPEPEMSPQRTAALSSARPTPGPELDPLGWTGKKNRQEIKSSTLFSHHSNKLPNPFYEAILLVPAPSVFPRLSIIPFSIKVCSTDPNLSSRFPLSSISVQLIQRAYVAAQGLVNCHEFPQGQITLKEDGPSTGTSESSSQSPIKWSKKFKGEIQLTRDITASFRTINLILQYVVRCTTKASNGSECVVDVPIMIVSTNNLVNQQVVERELPESRELTPRNSRPATPNLMPAPAFTDLPTNTSSTPMRNAHPDDDLGLPPSYFESMEGRETS